MKSMEFTVGRVIIGLIFAYMGFFKIMAWDNTAGWMAMKGLPFIPVLLTGAILLELVGGLVLAFGYRTRVIALLLAVFLIPTNIIFHNFWAAPEMTRASEQLSFLQNIAIIGGLIALSIRYRVGHKV